MGRLRRSQCHGRAMVTYTLTDLEEPGIVIKQSQASPPTASIEGNNVQDQMSAA